MSFVPFLVFRSQEDRLLLVSGCEGALKALEGIQGPKEIAVIVVSQTIPSIWSVLKSCGAQGSRRVCCKHFAASICATDIFATLTNCFQGIVAIKHKKITG